MAACRPRMNTFVGWRRETGLALFNVPVQRPLSLLFARLKHRHSAPDKGFSRAILVNFRMEDQDCYVRDTSGPMDHHAANSSPTLDDL